MASANELFKKKQQASEARRYRVVSLPFVLSVTDKFYAV